MNPKSTLDRRGEKTLRGINGALQWLVTNTRIEMAARVSFSSSVTSHPTVEELLYANKLVRQAIQDANTPVYIHSIPLKDLNFGVFNDAAWGVRADGSSQGGYLLYASHTSLLEGKDSPISPIDWKSWKLRRKVRSSLAAESQAMADAVDALNFARLFFADFLLPQGIDLRRVDEVLAHYVPQAQVVTDCKSLYDALERSESLTLGLAEKRTSIEVQAIKQQMLATNIVTKWVNSDRQLADVLTKPQVPTTNCLTL